MSKLDIRSGQVPRSTTIAEIALLDGRSVVEIERCLQSALVAKSLAEALQKMHFSD